MSQLQSRVRSAIPPLRVLVVDDEIDTANTLSVLVEMWGHSVWTANDAEAACALAGCFKPDVILLDIGLPRVDGLQLARRIRQDIQDARTVLIAVSGYVGEAMQRLAKDAGFDFFMAKPTDPNEIQAMLSKLAKVIAAARMVQTPMQETVAAGRTVATTGQS